MALTLKEAVSRREKKSFFLFPHWLFYGNKHWVPPVMKDEKMFFNKEKNPMYKTGDSRMYLVYKDRRIAGRVAVIANNKEVADEKLIRFGWLDFEDDRQVSAALMQAVEDTAREVGATRIEGPLGFCDLDNAGLLIEGFEEESTMATWYNFPYYKKHLENLGFAKKQDWVEYEFIVPKEIPERIKRMASIIAEKHKLRERPIKNKKDMRAISVEVLKLMAKTYKKLYNYVPLTDEQMAFYAEQFLNFLPPNYVMVLEDENGKLVAFAVTMPSLVKAAKKTKGYLFPLGFLQFLKAMRKNDTVELMLIGIDPAYQDKGITALIFQKLLNVFIQNGIKKVESNPEQEQNLEVQTLWKDYEHRQHKKRRVFEKMLE